MMLFALEAIIDGFTGGVLETSKVVFVINMDMFKFFRLSQVSQKLHMKTQKLQMIRMNLKHTVYQGTSNKLWRNLYKQQIGKVKYTVALRANLRIIQILQIVKF